MDLTEIFKRVKTASKSLALLTDEQRNEILMAVADAIVDYKERVLVANEKDLAKMDVKNPLYDRLQLTERIIPCRRMNLIKVNQRFAKNRIYVNDEDFDFVYNFLLTNCKNLKP